MSSYLSPQELSIAVEGQHEIADKICLEEKVVILQPIAMRIPNKHGVYSPSKLEPKKKMSYKEFLSRYADYPSKIRVCFDETPSSDTMLQRSELVTAYGFGFDCWYIVVTVETEKEDVFFGHPLSTY